MADLQPHHNNLLKWPVKTAQFTHPKLNLYVKIKLMKARKITQKQLYEMVAEGAPGVPLIPSSKLKWDVAVLIADCSNTKTKFSRSVSNYVDDKSKKSSFNQSITHLFQALQDDNYQATFIGSSVACKTARTFKYEGSSQKIWELKPNNKDRIYFYAATDLKPPRRKTIFLLMAFHKKNETTPAEAGDPCEEDVKNILKAKGNLDFCEEKNVSKK